MVNQDIADRIKASLEDDGRLSCATANKIARDSEVEPLQVGDAATSLDVRVSRCQLGLFGHGSQGKGTVVDSDMVIGDELAAAIREALVDGRLPCAAAWEIASRFKLTRLEMGNAAETLELRISPCQLGFF